MKVCNKCETTLWTSDRGFCPLCNPIENSAAHGIKYVPREELAIEAKEIVIPAQPVTLAEVTQAYIIKVYSECGQSKIKTSKKLGITVRTLYNHLNRYGVV
jgi:DNA-binding NtrC family response regulator